MMPFPSSSTIQAARPPRPRSDTDVDTASRRTQLIGAVIAIASGLTAGVLIRLHPEGLHAPAWVAYVAASAFVLAGLCLVAGAFAQAWLLRWLGIAVTLSLLAVSSWLAFGPGERTCSMSIPFFRALAPDALCRGAFGLGAILVALLLVLVVRRALWKHPES